MANLQHLQIVESGVEALNTWHDEYPYVRLELDHADLRDHDLAGACLAGAILDGSKLEGMNLTGTNFEGASLKRADMKGANLTDANLSRVKASQCVLIEANLTEVDLTDANLDGACLENAIVSADNEHFWGEMAGKGVAPMDHKELETAWDIVSNSDQWGHPIYLLRDRRFSRESAK